MKKMTVEQFKKQMSATEASFEKRAAAKLKFATELDPNPTQESAALRAAAGSASAYQAGLMAVARHYGLKKERTGHLGKKLAGFAWDLNAARKLVEAA